MFAVSKVIIATLLLMSSASALSQGIVWRTEKVRSSGAGCEFWGPQANAWIIAAGSDLSMVYSQLGQKFRTRRDGVDVSSCNVIVPAELSPGFYISAVDQVFLFGISKQKGVDVEVTAASNFVRRNAGGQPNAADNGEIMAKARLTFDAQEEVVKALEVVPMPTVRIRPRGNQNAPFERLCSKKRTRDLNFYSAMRVRVVRLNPDAQVSIAIDGQDLRLNMNNVVAPCPAN
jgi:hypothetical protein